MQLAITEPEWERLLSPEERGTGKCLSKFAVTKNTTNEQLGESLETSPSSVARALVSPSYPSLTGIGRIETYAPRSPSGTRYEMSPSSCPVVPVTQSPSPPPPPLPEPKQDNQLLQQTSSYWSVPEQTDPPALLAHSGTNWHGIAKWMTSKTHIMVKNFYQRQVDSGRTEWEEVAKTTDSLIEKGLPTSPLPTPAVIPKRRYNVSPTGLSRLNPGGMAGEQTDVDFQDASRSVRDPTSQSDPRLNRLSVSELLFPSGDDTHLRPQDHLNHEVDPKDVVLPAVSTMVSKGLGTAMDVMNDGFDFFQANTSSAFTGFSPDLAPNGTRDISRSASVIAMAATAAASFNNLGSSAPHAVGFDRHRSVFQPCNECRSGLPHMDSQRRKCCFHCGITELNRRCTNCYNGTGWFDVGLGQWEPCLFCNGEETHTSFQSVRPGNARNFDNGSETLKF
ncbi:hypothetical protein BKA61DRAFT_578450 [Leptodontidium sp. MPI-SDFR-AT-0119]|nr:hypothetical protein BKA61DRAFT_578450 [Leptodontidium sp. MPI-SDFR-AT-0119]